MSVGGSREASGRTMKGNSKRQHRWVWALDELNKLVKPCLPLGGLALAPRIRSQYWPAIGVGEWKRSPLDSGSLPDAVLQLKDGDVIWDWRRTRCFELGRLRGSFPGLDDVHDLPSQGAKDPGVELNSNQRAKPRFPLGSTVFHCYRAGREPASKKGLAPQVAHIWSQYWPAIGVGEWKRSPLDSGSLPDTASRPHPMCTDLTSASRHEHPEVSILLRQDLASDGCGLIRDFYTQEISSLSNVSVHTADTTICQVSEELLQVEPDEIDKITTYCQKALDCVDGEVDKASTKCCSPATIGTSRISPDNLVASKYAPLRTPSRAGVKKILTQKAIQIGGRVPNVWGSKDDAIKIFLSLRCNFVLGSLCQQLVPLLAKALSLPNLLRQAQQTGLIDFTRNPQPILRAQTSEENWDAMVWEPRTVMRAYKLSLQHAIEEDKEASTAIEAGNFPHLLDSFPPIQRKTFPIIRAKLQCGTSRVFKAANNLGATRFNQIEAFSLRTAVTCPFPSVLALRVRPAVRKLSRLNWQADGKMQQRIRSKQTYQFPKSSERRPAKTIDGMHLVFSPRRCPFGLEKLDRKPPLEHSSLAFSQNRLQVASQTFALGPERINGTEDSAWRNAGNRACFSADVMRKLGTGPQCSEGSHPPTPMLLIPARGLFTDHCSEKADYHG
ncbi:hypothetical protein C8R47DRAFT_1072885 [Mycena vitilis]|nr:hypothetical protein C8R47DRAFT_1072885 [Mycena vitilis]